MVDVSVIIPARNEKFLTKTIRDIVEKSRINTEVIAILEDYWPDEIVDEKNVNYIHFGTPRGMRGALNAGVAIAKGKYVMKLDAHCMVAEGFDQILAQVCQDNWVCVPRRHRLDPENWIINDGGRPPIDYQYIDITNEDFNGREWRPKNRDKNLQEILIDDIISCQGSSYFLPRDLWYELELLDEENYGTFRKDPQEVLFKCWTYGGRCVRVKSTWYAHLHKGRKYGRGYSTSSPDWRKGDEFVKRWWTDSAWPKQRIPLREVFIKFSDMPGWENHEWMKGADSMKDASSKRLPNLYQVLTLPNGTPFSKPRPDKQGSKFWNEGKWNTFIKPLLSIPVIQNKYPGDCVFVEMGCDAGLFLRMAEDRGFGHVIGVEKNKTPVKRGLEYRDTVGYSYDIMKRKLGSKFHEAGSFDIDELPVADVTLMSTFHYYIDINAWLKYLDRLLSKSIYVILVSRPELEEKHWIAKAKLDSVRGYFDAWREIGLVENISKENDPKPRDLYSIMFENPNLFRIDISEIDDRENDKNPMYRAMKDLAGRVASYEDFDIFDTDYFARWQERKRGKWSDRTLRRFVSLKLEVMKNVRDDGLMDPIILDHKNRLCDGGHRLVMLRALNQNSVIARVAP